MAVIPGAIESISAVVGKGWVFHGVLVAEWTDVAFCFSFVACKSVHIKNILWVNMLENPYF